MSEDLRALLASIMSFVTILMIPNIFLLPIMILLIDYDKNICINTYKSRGERIVEAYLYPSFQIHCYLKKPIYKDTE